MVSSNFPLSESEISEFFRLKSEGFLDSDFPPRGCPLETWKSICEQVNKPLYERYNFLLNKIQKFFYG